MKEAADERNRGDVPAVNAANGRIAKAGKKIPVDNLPVRSVSLGITLEVPAAV